MNIKCIGALLPASFASGGVWAAPITVSIDRTEVTDAATGLIWRRCVEGATPDTSGDCIGNTSKMTHEAALALTTNVAFSTGKVWRLPSVRELGSLISINTEPGIDVVAFPATPVRNHWTSTPLLSNSSRTWAVDFYSGFIFTSARTELYWVRLVRTGL